LFYINIILRFPINKKIPNKFTRESGYLSLSNLAASMIQRNYISFHNFAKNNNKLILQINQTLIKLNEYIKNFK